MYSTFYLHSWFHFTLGSNILQVSDCMYSRFHLNSRLALRVPKYSWFPCTSSFHLLRFLCTASFTCTPEVSLYFNTVNYSNFISSLLRPCSFRFFSLNPTLIHYFSTLASSFLHALFTLSLPLFHSAYSTISSLFFRPYFNLSPPILHLFSLPFLHLFSHLSPPFLHSFFTLSPAFIHPISTLSPPHLHFSPSFLRSFSILSSH